MKNEKKGKTVRVVTTAYPPAPHLGTHSYVNKDFSARGQKTDFKDMLHRRRTSKWKTGLKLRSPSSMNILSSNSAHLALLFQEESDEEDEDLPRLADEETEDEHPLSPSPGADSEDETEDETEDADDDNPWELVGGNVTSLGAHHDVIYNWRAHVLALQEVRCDDIGQEAHQFLSKQRGWSSVFGAPLPRHFVKNTAPAIQRKTVRQGGVAIFAKHPARIPLQLIVNAPTRTSSSAPRGGSRQRQT